VKDEQIIIKTFFYDSSNMFEMEVASFSFISIFEMEIAWVVVLSGPLGFWTDG
jgi:hypothetical protein